MAKDPYTVLGVARDASEEDIQKAFRNFAKKYHPDLNPGNKKAEDRFKEVNAAYDILGDAAKRARFDKGEIDASGAEIRPNPFAGGFRQGPGGTGGFHAGGREFAFEDLSDLFGGIFRGQGGFQGGGFQGGGFQGGGFQRPHGEDLHFTLDIDFIEAAVGSKKRITLPSGKTLDVNIPAGIADGQTIRLKGQGGAGPGEAGDALIEVKVRNHPTFGRDGQDIRIELPVTLQEAVLGAKVEVPTIHGPVTVTVPKGSNSGSVLRLKGKGIPGGKSSPAGDQYVTLKVMLPPKGDVELEEFLRAWGGRHPYNPRAELERS